MVEEQLIRAAQKGDRSAFAQLLVLVYDLIYRFAFKWAGNRFDAEDITQQACIKLANTIKQFRFESAFTTWLYQLVINCANDWGRTERRHSPPNMEQHPSTSDDRHTTEDNRSEAYVQLYQMLEQVDAMGKGFKETLLLVFAEGMSHAEAATILGVKESTVSWRIHEVRKHLKFIADEGEMA